MPLLARMLASPLVVDIRAGAVEQLPALLHQSAVSTTGTVLVAVGPSTGEEIWRRIEPAPEVAVKGASWGMVGIVLGALLGSASPGPRVLRVRGIELVDEEGRVVGRLAATGTGAELVLGGAVQASLVTEGDVAALNLIGAGGLARVVAADGAWVDTHAPPSEE